MRELTPESRLTLSAGGEERIPSFRPVETYRTHQQEDSKPPVVDNNASRRTRTGGGSKEVTDAEGTPDKPPDGEEVDEEAHEEAPKPIAKKRKS